MKIKTICISILFLTTLDVIAQPYQSVFGKNSTTWFTYGENINLTGTEKRDVIGDTVINGKNYKILNGYGTLFLREDTMSGRVWAYNGRDTAFNGDKIEEQLIQDMSLKMGDTIYFSRGVDGGTDTLIVEKVYFSSGLKHIELSRSFNYGFGKGKKLTFIEGVPSNVGFEYKMSPYLAIHPWLMCVFKDGNQVYGGGRSACTVSVENTVYSKNKIKVYPNPATNLFLIKGVLLRETRKIELFSLSGTKVKSWEMGSTEFYVNNIKPGIYLLKITINQQEFNQKLVIE